MSTTTNSQEIFNNLTQMIYKVYGLKKITHATIINGIAEDNDVFFSEFSRRFSIDMSLFKYTDYFYEDQFFILNILRGILFLFGMKRKKKIITVEHLVKVVETGKWIVPS